MVGPVPQERHGMRDGVVECGICEWSESLGMTDTKEQIRMKRWLHYGR